MSLYFLLGNVTSAGREKLRNNPNLVIEEARSLGVEGAQILGQYAVLGRYDFVMMVEAQDNDAAAHVSLELGVRVGLRIETLPAIAIGMLAEGGPEDSGRQPEVAEGPSEEWFLPGSEP